MDSISILLVTLIVIILIALTVLFVILMNSRTKESFLHEIQRSQAEQRAFNSSIIQLVADLKSSFTNDLMGFNHQLNDDFNSLSERTIYKLSLLEKNLHDNIDEVQKENSNTFTNIAERLTRIDAAQKNIEELSKDIAGLENILTDKKSRGIFGEIELYSLLENALGNSPDLWQKQVHFESGVIADAVIYGNSAFKMLCIDSKFPLENYRKIYTEGISEEERMRIKKIFRNDVLKHINAIQEKYIIVDLTSDFAFMFIPSEAIFSYIHSQMPDLVEISYKKKVYMVSPSLLMAYITAVKAIYMGQKRDEKAKMILSDLSSLLQDFRRLKERSEKMTASMESFLENYRLLEISIDKISRKFAKISSGEENEE